MVNPLAIVSVPGELAAALRVLPEVLEAVRTVGEDTRRMAENTAELPEVRANLDEVSRMTRVFPPMDERMVHIALMERLQESLEPLGRLADRVPGSRR